jgi:uncharacterized iron-regulated protein
MKQIRLIGFLIIAFVSLTTAQNKPAYALYNSKGKKVKYAKMIKKISESDVLFFGEQHNNPIAHWLQLEATKDLFELKVNNLVLGA